MIHVLTKSIQFQNGDVTNSGNMLLRTTAPLKTKIQDSVFMTVHSKTGVPTTLSNAIKAASPHGVDGGGDEGLRKVCPLLLQDL